MNSKLKFKYVLSRTNFSGPSTSWLNFPGPSISTSILYIYERQPWTVKTVLYNLPSSCTQMTVWFDLRPSIFGLPSTLTWQVTQVTLLISKKRPSRPRTIFTPSWHFIMSRPSTLSANAVYMYFQSQGQFIWIYEISLSNPHKFNNSLDLTVWPEVNILTRSFHIWCF